ncbi:sigma-70 family RNA polymerase sigma factor [Sphingobacterium sp. Mn56C]|uniref:sigma-70 family RNA polymerase sigma factor n=1 Tax=Sphingobacterium sp. Mn56C TaxID=3395261 RepID=UPI003BE48A19
MALDKTAFALYTSLFKDYYVILCANANFYLKDEEEAKELVQSFYVEIWENRSFLSWQGDRKAYLFKSVRNRCLNELKRKEVYLNKISDYTEDQSNEILRESEDSGDLEDVMVAMEIALKGLTHQRKEALTYVYLNKMPYKTAAAKMGISVNSLKTHLKLALKNLRQLALKVAAKKDY